MLSAKRVMDTLQQQFCVGLMEETTSKKIKYCEFFF